MKWFVPPHAQTSAAVLSTLRSSVAGLDAEEARRRLLQYGPNALPAAPRKHPLLRFFAQFDNTLIYVLLAGSIVAWSLGHIVDASVILIVVIINALVGFIQEGKAESALDAIRKMISPRAHVLRDGNRTTAAVADLVPGDIVLIEPGDRVPADLRLLRARGLLIDEAILTGESVPSEKNEKAVDSDAALGDRSSMAYSGTLVAAGQGTGIVVATGRHAEIGCISALLSDVEKLTTPLLRQINRFSQRFTWITFASAAFVFAFAILIRNYEWDDALIAVVALAIAAIPEGLPAVITITLAIGVQRMAAHNAVIRHLPAVETLGATSVICSDKTGTLTRNEMTVRRVVVPSAEITVSGSGYAPEGKLSYPEGDSPDTVRTAALALIRTGLLCNDAHLYRKSGSWRVHGDPMEGALVAVACKAGLDPASIRSEWTRHDEIPFDAQHRFMASLHDVPEGGTIIFLKGAPERVLEMCKLQANGGDLNKGAAPVDLRYWNDRIAAAAAEGERVLGFAVKPVAKGTKRLIFEDVDSGLVFLGLVGFIDPPRQEAVAAIKECRSAGISVKIITGDHGATAAAIARQLGLDDNPRVLTGRELDSLPSDEVAEVIARTSVFARTSPAHKLRIVKALQARGATVAMTGDGVNDAPSLKQADVGIAMGQKGTEAAKEASQMVLLDDNFASIVFAVHEGRTVYDNIRKVTSWTLPTNGGEVLTVVASILMGFTMPMTAAQILWINMTTAVTLGLVLAFEPPEPNVMHRPPRSAAAGLLTPFTVWRVVFVSLIFVVASLSVFFYALGKGLDIDTARTMVVNTIVVLEIFYLFNVRYLHMTSLTWKGALGTRPVLIAVSAVVAAQFAFTYLPLMQQLFSTKPVSLADGLIICSIGIVAMAILEGEKQLMRRLGLLKTWI